VLAYSQVIVVPVGIDNLAVCSTDPTKLEHAAFANDVITLFL
jgi:hypothetical protein